MPSEPLSLGFIGGGLNSAVGLTHKIAAQMDGYWQLSAGCFSSQATVNAETAQAWQVPGDRLYDDWQTMLKQERGRLDAVVVLTPTPQHVESVVAALELGYPVICEKALATSSAEIRTIRQAVESHHGFLAVTYNYTGYPMLRELQHLISQGRLGELQQIHIEMPQEGFLRLDRNAHKATPQAWRLRDNAVPTLSLDLGVHVHQIIHFLSHQQPREVVASSNNYGLFDGIVDNTLCIAQYSGDLQCQIWFGKTALGHSNGLRVRVYGKQGSAEWFQLQPDSLTVNDNTGTKTIVERSSAQLALAAANRYNRFKPGHPSGFMEAFANLYTDLADRLTTFNTTPSRSIGTNADLDIAEQGLTMLEAMQTSAREHCWQAVADTRQSKQDQTPPCSA